MVGAFSPTASCSALWVPPQGTLPRSPHVKRTRFPQEKVFEHELPFARWERGVADPARYFKIDGLRARWSFDNLVESEAAFAAEKRNCIGVRHVERHPRQISSHPADFMLAGRV
jgi:hypothetical protein